LKKLDCTAPAHPLEIQPNLIPQLAADTLPITQISSVPLEFLKKKIIRMETAVDNIKLKAIPEAKVNCRDFIPTLLLYTQIIVSKEPKMSNTVISPTPKMCIPIRNNSNIAPEKP
jgi:hypothetical protein